MQVRAGPRAAAGWLAGPDRGRPDPGKHDDHDRARSRVYRPPSSRATSPPPADSLARLAASCAVATPRGESRSTSTTIRRRSVGPHRGRATSRCARPTGRRSCAVPATATTFWSVAFETPELSRDPRRGLAQHGWHAHHRQVRVVPAGWAGSSSRTAAARASSPAGCAACLREAGEAVELSAGATARRCGSIGHLPDLRSAWRRRTAARRFVRSGRRRTSPSAPRTSADGAAPGGRRPRCGSWRSPPVGQTVAQQGRTQVWLLPTDWWRP